jgi:WXG100 family type VII secretion target
MSADVVQGNYEQLQQVATRFQRQSEQIGMMEAQLRRGMQKLESSWEGRGSQAFNREMANLTLPGIVRLKNALTQAHSITAKIANTLKQAEDEAAKLFKGEGSGGGGNGNDGAGGGGLGNGSGGDSSGGGGNSGGGSGSDGPTLPTPMDTATIYSEQYMTEMTKTVVPGSDSPALNDAMEQLMRDPNGPNKDSLLAIVARERGVPLDQMQAQYERYLQLRDARQDGSIVDVDTDKRPDFLGSTTSLRYGKVVGDALGIDPVFGALLNPTGGLMGPNNGLPFQPGPNEPLGFHSVFHDAGGYLKNSHGIGPGYDYLGREGNYDAGNPYTGQVSGIDYWNDKIDTGFGTWAKTEGGEKVMWVVREGDRAIDWTVDKASSAWNWTKDTASSGWDWVKGRF